MIPVQFKHEQASPKASLQSSHPIPLILVHGIGAEEEKQQLWAKFLEFSKDNPDFQNRYKVYLFRYNSSQSVPILSREFQHDIREILAKSGNAKFRILAYSKGGLIVLNALQDPTLNERAEKIITVATPFHGSPLATPDWIERQLKDDPLLSPVRMTNKVSYWITTKKYPTFVDDFHWDNFDRALPEEMASKFNPRQSFIEYFEANRHKWVTYGSYFGVGIDPEQNLQKALGIQTPLPVEKPHFRNPMSRHFLFSLVRNNISKLPLAYAKLKQYVPHPGRNKSQEVAMNAGDGLAMTAQAEEQTANEQARDLTPLMVYNDGISPISSSLWLGRFTKDYQNIPNPTQRMLVVLKDLQNTQYARLFQGLDHRDLLDGSTRIEGNRVRDLLHPGEPARTTFEWFMMDLMDDSASLAHADVSGSTQK